MLKKDLKKMISVEINQDLHDQLKKAVELDSFTIRQIIEYGLAKTLKELDEHRASIKKDSE